MEITCNLWRHVIKRVYINSRIDSLRRRKYLISCLMTRLRGFIRFVALRLEFPDPLIALLRHRDYRM